jgi:hypothetical protein
VVSLGDLGGSIPSRHTMDESEKKIRKILYKMIEKRFKEYPKEIFRLSFMETIDNQILQGKISKERMIDMKKYAEILLEEFYRN